MLGWGYFGRIKNELQPEGYNPVEFRFKNAPKIGIFDF
jgi:hypothetical protein